MLNLSENSIDSRNVEHYSTVKKLHEEKLYTILNKIVLVFVVLAIVLLFLPWTQNIRGSGFVTTLKPNQRPQTIQSIIPGRIENWYVQEGDYVNKGDTILQISEVKESYLDPNLVQNTQRQLTSKQLSVESYKQKVQALEGQMNALQSERSLKIEQAKNKVTQTQFKIESDSIDLIAANTNLTIAQRQYDRIFELQQQGLKSLKDVEEKKLKLQEVQAKLVTQQNKLQTSKNDLLNAKYEVTRIKAMYEEKLAKAKSDQMSALSNQYESEVQTNKLDNQLANYTLRNTMYYIKAPQSGYINRTLKSGIGETIKEGTPIASIMPASYQLAVETFVSPMDLPLIHKGEQVRIWFEGWPTVVFSGWPDVSYGTFGGKIVAIENFISDNGKYRILIAPDETAEKWPEKLQIGAGAQTIALLNEVPIWYEIWRTLNGFPPDYYTVDQSKEAKKK
ncbi:MAG: HlyD family efflux transporter periplasmic adaptor subunit [Flavobacteriales bacterium]|nr:HlyD family efflux transporter periplasmic adaptor subunit [Flavobacteriales bacterium]